MKTEIKICQNCKKDFVIEVEDFNFYEKIKVPPPTFCPECRSQRRLSWRNERSLYKRNDAFGNKIISIYAPEQNFTVYEREYWWSDKWDPMEYFSEIDFSKTLFKQFSDLLHKVPLPSFFASNAKNSEYVNHVGYLTRCYLTYASWECEDVCYGEKSSNSKNLLDAYSTHKSEYCYETIDCTGSFQLSYGRDCYECIDSAFLYDCRNCQNCFGCVGLRNKKYCIFNTQYSKEDYQKIVNDFNVGSYINKQAIIKKFADLQKSYPHKYAMILKSIDTVGDHCQNLKNCQNCFDLVGPVENSKYIIHGGLNITDSYDGYGVGADCDMLYECIDSGAKGGSKEIFSVVVYGCRETNYCFNCENSSNLFACIGLRNKQYCILNKQYTKEQYEKLVPKIIQHMNDMPYVDNMGNIYKYGEFFPSELSPFCYNETVAQEYFPLTKEQALKQGYKWKDKEERNYAIDIKPEDVPDDIKDVDESIINKVIECEHKGECNEQCTEAFKIIESELQFYKKMNLPLPRLCPNCRHYTRLKQRNPLKLWHRACMCDKTAHNHEGKCTVEFETSYAPDRPEIVYCEKCYQQEVY